MIKDYLFSRFFSKHMAILWVILTIMNVFIGEFHKSILTLLIAALSYEVYRLKERDND